MLRKLFRQSVLAGLVLGSLSVTAQTPKPVVSSNFSAAKAVDAASGNANSAAVAEIWYKTAEYIFQHDPELHPIANKLVAKLSKNSLDSFRRSLDDAIKVEGKPLKYSHVSTFQSSFKEIQAQQPASPAAVIAAIEASKLGTKRKDDQQFLALMHSLSQAAGADEGALTSPIGAATAKVPATDNPMNEIGAAPAAAPVAASSVAPLVPASTTSPLLWLALGMASLALLGLAVLLNKLGNTRNELAIVRRTLEASSPKASGNSASPAALTSAIKQEITRQIDQRVADKQAKAAVAPAIVPPIAASPEVAILLAPAAPGPRLRTQYANEAPFNNSFPARALSDQPGTYSMFAIVSSEQQPDQGTFAVTGNLASHVRDHRSVLEPVCEYLGGYPLGSEARVITVEPGLVRRRGDDWEVVQRAKVRFE